MDIRAITLFIEPSFSPKNVANFFLAAQETFPEDIQSQRLATTPFPTWFNPADLSQARIEETILEWLQAGAEYICLGPVRLQHDDSWLAHLPDLIAGSDRLFASAEIASTAGYLDVGRCWTVADIIRQISTLEPDGMANFRFAALAHCSPGSPFFPAAYHVGGSARFSIAVQAADLAVKAINEASSIVEARINLVRAIEKAASAISDLAGILAADQALIFEGIDFSLAPAPGMENSLAAAIEGLGLAALGLPGSLAAAAFIAEAIDRAKIRRCGFSGLILPPLEDVVLAERVADGQVTLTSLLSYAAVCGTGLDTIPLPGNISDDTLAGILLDVGALSVRLKKSLTARLMPLPGRVAGDPVEFSHPSLVPGKVMAVQDELMTGLLKKPARFKLRARDRRQ